MQRVGRDASNELLLAVDGERVVALVLHEKKPLDQVAKQRRLSPELLGVARLTESVLQFRQREARGEEVAL
jgi:hypothetical protein